MIRSAPPSRMATGGWQVAIHFRQPPEEASLRSLVALAAGEAASRRLRIEPVAAADWVAQSLADLKPVRVGRFLVHGAHDRAKLRANDIGIEIEAALAFGTGHHGTTRGCLAGARRSRKAPASPPRARCRHRQRDSGDCRGKTSSCPHHGKRYRCARDRGGARKCAHQSRCVPGHIHARVRHGGARDHIRCALSADLCQYSAGRAHAAGRAASHG